MGVEDAEKRDRELGVVNPELKTGEENIVQWRKHAANAEQSNAGSRAVYIAVEPRVCKESTHPGPSSTLLKGKARKYTQTHVTSHVSAHMNA